MHVAHQLNGYLQLLGLLEQLVLAQGDNVTNLAVHLAHVAHGLHDVARAGLALRANHGRALGDAAQGLAQIARTAYERHREARLVDVIGVVGRGEDLGLVDVVNLNGLQELGFHEVADTALGHDGDGHGFLDAADHLGVAHAADAASGADVGRDALERHDGAGTGFLGDASLLRRGDVHDDAALEHLGKLLIELVAGGTGLVGLIRVSHCVSLRLGRV